MPHRDRNEQRAIKVRKDPNQLARRTQVHKVHRPYDAVDIANDIAEYFTTIERDRHDQEKDAS